MIARIIKITSIFIVFAIVGGISAYLTLTMVIRGEDTVIVPDLSGKKVMYALKTLTALGLNTKIGGTEYREDVPLNRVIFQEPEPGTEIKKGRDVKIIISKGSQTVLVPDLKGLTLQEGVALLEESGLCRGVASLTYSRNIKKDKIIDHTPSAGSAVNKKDCIDLLVSFGIRLKAYKMPDLKGLLLEDAILVIEQHNLQLGYIRSVFSKGKPQGTVIKQEPAAGYHVIDGTIVHLESNRKSDRKDSARVDFPKGVNLLKYKADNGFIKSRIRVKLEWLGISSDIHDGFVKPGKEIWLLIPRGDDIRVFVYRDNELIETRVFNN